MATGGASLSVGGIADVGTRVIRARRRQYVRQAFGHHQGRAAQLPEPLTKDEWFVLSHFKYNTYAATDALPVAA